MPWRGPQYPGEAPTLGVLVGNWIEENLIIPDGVHFGEPYKLTDEMWNHVLHRYQLRPTAVEADAEDAFLYKGSQLVRPQKWGKDPFMAALDIFHALGPCVFAGWDANGDPVGRPHPSAWIVVAATAEDQVDNTWRPILNMLRDGPLADTPGLDIGETRIKLPGIGWIDPVTRSAKARLGARYTHASLTETHLLNGEGPTGGLTFVRAIKRNVGGMNGMWIEGTNPWDPTEDSAAQKTYEAKARDVFVDYRRPRSRPDLDDEEAVLAELRHVYGDSLRSRGGWVSERRILSEVQDPATGESEARRYYLQEITAGTSDAINAPRWLSLARTEDPLVAGEEVALGFDGSRSRDATAIWICRIRDGRLFKGRIWVPAECEGGRVPRLEVDGEMNDIFGVYDVKYLFYDPWMWQDYGDVWSARWPGRVVEFATNVEARMDKLIERFQTAYKAGELTHDGDETLTQHAKNAALAKGKKKAPREDDDPGNPASKYYLKLAKKRHGLLIDAFVAAHLAYAARGQAVEDGALEPKRKVELWGFYE